MTNSERDLEAYRAEGCFNRHDFCAGRASQRRETARALRACREEWWKGIDMDIEMALVKLIQKLEAS